MRRDRRAQVLSPTAELYAEFQASREKIDHVARFERKIAIAIDVARRACKSTEAFVLVDGTPLTVVLETLQKLTRTKGIFYTIKQDATIRLNWSPENAKHAESAFQQAVLAMERNGHAYVLMDAATESDAVYLATAHRDDPLYEVDVPRMAVRRRQRAE